MAGEIQVNSVTALTESGSNIVLNNVDTATNRTNLGLGSMATQNANAVSITGGTIDIDVIGFAKTIASDLTATGVLTFSATNAFINGMTESSGTITIQTAGRYFAYASLYVGHSSTSTNYIQSNVRVNTTVTLASGADNYNSGIALRGTSIVGGIINVAVNDTVDFYVIISGSGTVFSGSTQSLCNLFYLGQ